VGHGMTEQEKIERNPTELTLLENVCELKAISTEDIIVV
jgi:hypothetical protein